MDNQPIDTLMPVTVRIDGSIHNAMKNLARHRRVHISLLYEQAAEAFVNSQMIQKTVENKPNVSRGTSR